MGVRDLELENCIAPCQTPNTRLSISQREVNRIKNVVNMYKSGLDTSYIATVTGTSEARIAEIIEEMKAAANDLADIPRGRRPKNPKPRRRKNVA